jgi:hypothetical protein
MLTQTEVSVLPALLALVSLTSGPQPSGPVDHFADMPVLAARIDAFVDAHWQEEKVKPAAATDDLTFLRRVTLDLTGRIPTVKEAMAFADDRSADKRARAVRRLMESPEYALHMGRVLDDMIQGKFAGEAEFLEYLRASVAEHKPWDQMFREMMLGPWDAKERKNANRFLTRRANSLDDLTTDTARVFFGVNVSCAKCHDHPLVDDWKQDHYYGMASFFQRTYEGSKGKGGNGAITEKAAGPVQFVTTKGERRNARMLFLSGRVVEEPEKSVPFSPREELVKISLEEKHFFSRAIANRMWAYLLGRGLVNPTDQLHSANPPSIPDVLEWLADDLAEHGYDLDRLVAGLVSSRVYQLAGTKTEMAQQPADTMFARAALRSLTPQQYALSMVLATGDGTYDQTAEAARAKRYRELEGQSGVLTRPGLLDPRSDRFQSSTGEALFMSNHPEVQKLVTPTNNNLVARLAALTDAKQIVETATWSVLSRPPQPEEQAYLAKWIEEHKDRPKACSQLVWALLTSAEFRFNH